MRLTLEPSLGGINMTLEDNGPGVKPEFRDKIFDVFSTLTRRDEKDSSGLGLAIIKKVVDQYDGIISVGDSDLGGLGIKITLPIETIKPASNTA